MEFTHIAIKKDFIETLEAILQHDIPQELSTQIIFKLKLLKNENNIGHKVRDRGPEERDS